MSGGSHFLPQLLQTLNRLKVRVPDHLRLVGFDDIRFANLLTIPLTTMQQPCCDIALTAFNCMQEAHSQSLAARKAHHPAAPDDRAGNLRCLPDV